MAATDSRSVSVSWANLFTEVTMQLSSETNDNGKRVFSQLVIPTEQESVLFRHSSESIIRGGAAKAAAATTTMAIDDAAAASDSDEEEEDEEDIDSVTDAEETRIAKALAHAAFTASRNASSSNNQSTTTLADLLMNESRSSMATLPTTRTAARRQYAIIMPKPQQAGVPVVAAAMPKEEEEGPATKKARLMTSAEKKQREDDQPTSSKNKLRWNVDTLTATVNEQKKKSAADFSSLMLRMRLSQSAPSLQLAMKKKQQAAASGNANWGQVPSKNPSVFLRDLLKADGKGASTLIGANNKFKTVPATTLTGFFQPQTTSGDGYDMEIAMAVRRNDVATMKRRLYDAGRRGGRRNLNGIGNKFGETIVHTACRRGAKDVLEFFIRQAQVNVRVCCDSGRTPLHDACWTADPNLQVVALLLEECPDLLYIADRRGFTPLDYIHKENWGAWCSFLQAQGVAKLLPKELEL